MSYKKPRKPRSPYDKYDKSPYRYSDTYLSWHAEVVRAMSNDTEHARALEARHRKEMNLPPRGQIDHSFGEAFE